MLNIMWTSMVMREFSVAAAAQISEPLQLKTTTTTTTKKTTRFSSCTIFNGKFTVTTTNLSHKAKLTSGNDCL